jgi:hypothetical protein
MGDLKVVQEVLPFSFLRHSRIREVAFITVTKSVQCIEHIFTVESAQGKFCGDGSIC